MTERWSSHRSFGYNCKMLEIVALSVFCARVKGCFVTVRCSAIQGLAYFYLFLFNIFRTNAKTLTLPQGEDMLEKKEAIC